MGKLTAVVLLATGIVHLTMWALIQLALYPLSYISLPFHRKIENTCYGWLAQWILFLVEKVGNCPFYVYGDQLPTERENVLMISNHIGDVDGFQLVALAMRYNSHSISRYALKNVLRYVFPIGTLLSLHETLFLRRSFEHDSKVIVKQLNALNRPHRAPMWLMIYPEGTYISPQRIAVLEASKQFARANGLPELNNVLTPRTRGVQLMLPTLLANKQIDAVYDVTLAYSGPFDQRLGVAEQPKMMHHFSTMLPFVNPQLGRAGEPVGVHVHVRRIPAADLINELQPHEQENTAQGQV